MVKFSYVAKDQNAKTYKEVIDAPHKQAVIDKLQQQGLFVVSINEVGGGLSQKRVQAAKRKRRFTHSNVKLDDILAFARQLATMLEAGVTLIRSLDVITV